MAEINKTKFKGLGLPEHFDPSLDALKQNMNIIDDLLQRSVPNVPQRADGVDGGVTNLNTLTTPGKYITVKGAKGAPINTEVGVVEVSRVGNSILQEWRAIQSLGLVGRRWISGGIKSNWYIGWNSLNDGAGSGLDADKLDGYESYDFAKLNHSTSDFNSVTPGFWYVNSTVNAPHNFCSYWGCLVFRTGSATGNSYLIQIASPRGTSDTDTSDNTLGLYYRKFYNGTWLSWNVLYDSSRSSSGINAEFLNGYTWDNLNIFTIIGSSSPSSATPIDDMYGTQESEHTPLLYVKSGYFKIGSGDTDFLVAPALITIEPYSAGNSDEVVLFDSADLVTVINYSGITTYKVEFNNYKSTEVSTRINVTKLNGYYGDKYTLKSEILDELKAVDGEGSGLDADLLDGKHAHQLAQYGTASGTLATVGNLTETSIGESQMYRFYDSSNLIGEGTDKYYGIMQIYYSASYYVRIAVSMSSGKVYRQTNGASSWSELTPHIPVLSADPSNPSEGQMWILNSN